MNKIRQIFCKHSYEKVAWYEEYDEYRHERFAMRLYKCQKCGTEIWVDGRTYFVQYNGWTEVK